MVSENAASNEHGRVDVEGTVWVRTPDGSEVSVGSWAAGSPQDGLAFYSRKFADLEVEVDLAERRLRDGKANPDTVLAMLVRMREQLATPAVVGDLAGLAAKCDVLDGLVAEQRARKSEEKAAAKAQAHARRDELVAEAESLAESTQWKSTGDRFRTLLEEWKTAPHIERSVEQAMWKRFSHARSVFDRRRRQHFARLDAERDAAKAAKEAIVVEAETLATSTDWAGTASAYRDLMARWKASARAGRTDEDALWARFRTAQDAFFAARSASLDSRDAGLRENLAAKQALAAEAEALLPVKDPKSAKAALRDIQERWESAGHVPRGDRDAIEARFKRVEDVIRGAESDVWRSSNPEARARADQTVTQFRASVEKLEKQLLKAQEAGDARKVHDLENSLQMTRALLGAAENALAEFGG